MIVRALMTQAILTLNLPHWRFLHWRLPLRPCVKAILVLKGFTNKMHGCVYEQSKFKRVPVLVRGGFYGKGKTGDANRIRLRDAAAKALDTASCRMVPVYADPALNERCYGNLQVSACSQDAQVFVAYISSWASFYYLEIHEIQVPSWFRLDCT